MSKTRIVEINSAVLFFIFKKGRSKMKHVIHCRMKTWSFAVLTKLNKCNCWIKKDKFDDLSMTFPKKF